MYKSEVMRGMSMEIVATDRDHQIFPLRLQRAFR
jgi:hypothetical protein